MFVLEAMDVTRVILPDLAARLVRDIFTNHRLRKLPEKTDSRAGGRRRRYLGSLEARDDLVGPAGRCFNFVLGFCFSVSWC